MAVASTVLCLFGLGLLGVMAAPRAKQKKKAKKVDMKVYLLHADELRYDTYGPNPEAQIVKGHVAFLHQGSRLNCDSAYFYESSNSVKAFGHVHFRQGDTLSLTCDHAWYDGATQMMQARKDVVLKHRGQTLYTDSLNYDRLYSNAYFFKGGRLIDKTTRLSSDWGEYSTATKQAVFYFDVQLHTPKNRVSTDTLYYDTRTKRAHVVGKYTPNKGNGRPGPSIITGSSGTIHTENAFFNTATDQSELFGRSTVENKEKVITGDTLFYNSKTGANRGRGNVVYIDKKNKNEMHCGYMEYNEKTGRGFATRRALTIDYSRKDTLYMHADTMRIETFHINTDSVQRVVHCYPHVRAYRVDLQAVCDSMVLNSKDSCMTMYKDPIIWNNGRQLLGEKILVFFNDSTIRESHVLGQALSVELLPDSTHYNQVSSRDMFAYFEGGALRRSIAVGNVLSVFYPMDSKDSSLVGLNYMETDTMKMYMGPQGQIDRIWAPKSQGTIYPMSQIPSDKSKLPAFAWFEELRPHDKDDVFVWKPKNAGTELRKVERHRPKLPTIGGGH